MNDHLTPRMAEAAALVRNGMTNAQIAEAMGLTIQSAATLVKQTRQRVALPMRNRWNWKRRGVTGVG